MNVLTKEGSSIVVTAVDADGLDIAVPQPLDWAIDKPDLFTLTMGDDGVSATIVPVGPTGSATLTVSTGDLQATADVSYTNETPPDRVAAKLNLVFTPIPPAAAVVAPG